jgi:hypothetical protein
VLIPKLDFLQAELDRYSICATQLGSLTNQRNAVTAKIEKYLLLRAWWLSYDVGTGQPAAGWELKADADLAVCRKTTAGTRVFSWDKNTAGIPRLLVARFMDITAELARSLEEVTIFLPMELSRALRYWLRYAACIDGTLERHEKSIAKLLGNISGMAGNLPAANASAEVDRLLGECAYLRRRRAEVSERQQQGRESVSTWFGKGKGVFVAAATDVAAAATAAAVIASARTAATAVSAASAAAPATAAATGGAAAATGAATGAANNAANNADDSDEDEPENAPENALSMGRSALRAAQEIIENESYESDDHDRESFEA